MPKQRVYTLSSANVIQVDGNGLSADTESDEWAYRNGPSCSLSGSNIGDIWRQRTSKIDNSTIPPEQNRHISSAIQTSFNTPGLLAWSLVICGLITVSFSLSTLEISSPQQFLRIIIIMCSSREVTLCPTLIAGEPQANERPEVSIIGRSRRGSFQPPNNFLFLSELLRLLLVSVQPLQG
ncbi:hypothetical protein CEXT_391571 [Caerostris extrusa]|uniref:Uncharacterized protein n=1 Tax=Caerostris extrusa TaxID=172846 RepID=A0AAV4XHJ7_CAEEX|nr:hypothetical protein CEXT_391571 [Caerostris extrusa]